MVVTNAYIQRQMRLISITYLINRGNNGKAQPRLKVHNVNTISNYGSIWRGCAKRMIDLNITNNIADENMQFCYCDESQSILSVAAGHFNRLNV